MPWTHSVKFSGVQLCPLGNRVYGSKPVSVSKELLSRWRCARDTSSSHSHQTHSVNVNYFYGRCSGVPGNVVDEGHLTGIWELTSGSRANMVAVLS